jgi:hypothetical protein
MRSRETVMVFSHEEEKDKPRDRNRSAVNKRGEEGEIYSRICRNIRHNLAGIKSYEKVS